MKSKLENKVTHKYSSEDKKITITKTEYDQLVESQKLLRALRNAGIDNWEGYESALESFQND